MGSYISFYRNHLNNEKAIYMIKKEEIALIEFKGKEKIIYNLHNNNEEEINEGFFKENPITISMVLKNGERYSVNINNVNKYKKFIHFLKIDEKFVF